MTQNKDDKIAQEKYKTINKRSQRLQGRCNMNNYYRYRIEQIIEKINEWDDTVLAKERMNDLIIYEKLCSRADVPANFLLEFKSLPVASIKDNKMKEKLEEYTYYPYCTWDINGNCVCTANEFSIHNIHDIEEYIQNNPYC